MNTTSLLVDILIIGIQVLLWICGFLFSYVIPIDLTTSIYQNYAPIAITVLISVSYALGIVFDYIISDFFDLFITRKEKASRKEKVLNIINHSTEIHKFLDNQYARLRIVRGTAFNLPLIAISLSCLIISNDIVFVHPHCITILIILSLGAIGTLLSIWSWKRRKEVYLRFVEDTMNLINKK